MDRRQLLFVLPALALGSGRALAQAPEVVSVLPGGRKVGEGRLSILMMPVFDAALYGPGGRWAPDQPFVLTAKCLRVLESQTLIRRALDEIRSQGFRDADRLEQWERRLQTVLPTVHSGEVLTAVFTSKGQVRFFHNARETGSIDDRDFAMRFADICLSPQTSQPGLRRALLGLAATG